MTPMNFDTLMHYDIWNNVYPDSFDFALLTLTVLTIVPDSMREKTWLSHKSTLKNLTRVKRKTRSKAEANFF